MGIRFDARQNKIITDGTSVDFDQPVTTPASTTSAAGLNIAEAVAAPTAPVDGDVWVTAAGAFNARLNGATIDLSATGGDVSAAGTPVNNQIGVWTSASTIEGDANLTWTGSTLTLAGAGAQLLLPSESDDATPTLAFGDGDSGFYEVGDDVIGVALGGSATFYFQTSSSYFTGAGSQSFYVRNTGATSTVPTLGPRRDFDTGLGQGAADQLSLIAGGVEIMRLVEDTTDYVHFNTPLMIAERAAAITNQTGFGQLWAGTDNSLNFTDEAGTNTILTAGGSGTVTSVSVVSANGLAGSVATATTTPAITLSTSITGVLKGNGTAISAATAGTDYSAGTNALATGILKSTTTTGALSIALAGDFPTLNQNTTGTAAGLSATLAETSGGTGTATYATGDILYASAANTLSKLAAGTNTHVLTLAAGVPTWAASGNVSNTGTPINNQIAVWTDATTIEGSSDITWNGTIFSVGGNASFSKTTINELSIVEQAAADVDVPTEGQIWVKDDTPCNLYFTDDTGQDVQITSNGSLAVSGFISGTVANDQIVVGTGTSSVDSSANFTSTGTVISVGGGGTSSIPLRIADSDTSDYTDIYNNGTDTFFDVTGSGNIDLRQGTTRMASFQPVNCLFYRSGTLNMQTNQHDGSGQTSGVLIKDHAGNLRPAGFNNVQQFSMNVSDTLEARHAGGITGKHGVSTAYTLTLADATDTDFPVFHSVQVINGFTSGDYTITEGASTTLYYLDGSTRTDTAGGCTLGPGGVATIYRYAAGIYYIWGSGITP